MLVDKHEPQLQNSDDIDYGLINLASLISPNEWRTYSYN